jgi:polysaccharide deacetylase 2 family uncharacterized protein YibQ
MTKRKSSRNRLRREDRLIAWISYLVVVLVLTVVAVGTGYYFGYQKGQEHMRQAYAQERAASHQMVLDLRKAAADRKRAKEGLRRDGKTYGAAHEYTDATVVDKPVERPLRRTAALPKLAIIIDDVAFARDVRLIKALNLPLTMSFLPPSDRHPDSAKLAAGESYYMVHLPLEAKNFSAEEPATLRVGYSQEEISRRVAEIKTLFPKVEYINNHTGSAFTADETAMNRLIAALDRYHIGFIDSRTTAETKVPVVMKSYGRPYLARDLFLDHHPDIGSVKKAIRRAVRIAKKHGSAIAIGHPHANTLEALEQSKELLKEVQLVRMDHYF